MNKLASFFFKRKSSTPAHDVRPYLKAPHPDEMAMKSGNDMEKIFYSHTGRQSFKWHHYLEIYHKYLNPWRGKEVRVLEVGVQYGGSLQILRKYLGENAIIFGIDIDERCRSFDDDSAHVRIGSQADPIFLKKIVEEMGGVDVVIDDGSHIAEHQEISFKTLFPLLNYGGVYICEDLQASYWEVFHNGGYQRDGTFIELSKQLIDDMHSWYHVKPEKILGNASSSVYSISMFDGLVAIEKRIKERGYFSGMPPMGIDCERC
jgi:hypothetical protein